MNTPLLKLMLDKREELARDIGVINAAYISAENTSVKVTLNNTFHNLCNCAMELDKAIEDVMNTLDN